MIRPKPSTVPLSVRIFLPEPTDIFPQIVEPGKGSGVPSGMENRTEKESSPKEWNWIPKYEETMTDMDFLKQTKAQWPYYAWVWRDNTLLDIGEGAD